MTIISNTKNVSFKELREFWRQSVLKTSGNILSNSNLSKDIADKFLNDNYFCLDLYSEKIKENEVFPLNKILFNCEIPGFSYIGMLQGLSSPGCLTVFRAIRFPNPSRAINVVYSAGITEDNYEQERLYRIYNDIDYINKRKDIQKDRLFAFQPQERIVEGLPVFFYANDAIQIHSGYRGVIDRIILVVAFIPKCLIDTKKLTLKSNLVADLNYNDDSGDREIDSFILCSNDRWDIDYNYYIATGTNIYEAYFQNFPLNINEAESIGINQRIFAIDLISFEAKSYLSKLSKIDIENVNKIAPEFFTPNKHFGRNNSLCIPFKCCELFKSK